MPAARSPGRASLPDRDLRSLGAGALEGVEAFERLEILYWLDRSRRDLILQSPGSNGKVRGTFALRSPVRPNPIGTSIVALDRVEGNALFVRGLDCLDGTPLLDLKPDRSLFKDRAAAARRFRDR